MTMATKGFGWGKGYDNAPEGASMETEAMLVWLKAQVMCDNDGGLVGGGQARGLSNDDKGTVGQ